MSGFSGHRRRVSRSTLLLTRQTRFQKRKTDVNGFGWELDGNRVNLNGIGIKSEGRP